ncbi:AN1-type zinc finger protein 2A-like [Palaemon carinicauda]|uniref:AN1-type zinc finger protein 2A-like n=1 Tax=Palaemon carinicauda TaxID=392227 RepID=UPI0035B5867D
MELPHLGKHCAEPTCFQLDFLPFTCNLCKKEFCVDHHTYTAHNCAESYRADVQVPICPLCDQPVPSKRGQPPDLAVNDHLENNCKNKAKTKIYTNKCSAPKCKGKEMVKVTCDSCGLDFCLRHRHTLDHNCKGPLNPRERAAAAAATRVADKSKNNKQTSSSSNGILKYLTPAPGGPRPTGHTPPSRGASISSIQGGLSEDEAMARALAASMQDASGSSSQGQQSQPSGGDNEDELLAQAIAASLEQRQGQNNAGRNSCNIC